MQNKDRLKRYREQRKEKNHEISEEEWIECLSYFNNSCAYCGMTMDEHLEKYNQSLHKEHVDDNGSNKIDNCVPSCRICNSSKHTRKLEDWYYNESDGLGGVVYSDERLEKIYSWIKMKS